MALEYITKDDGLLLDAKSMTLYNARNVLSIAVALHIIELEKRLLTDIISQQLNRQNVLEFLQRSFLNIQQIQSSYFEADQDASENQSDNLSSPKGSDDSDEECKQEDGEDAQKSIRYVLVDDNQVIEEVRKQEETWLDLFYYAIDLTAANIEHIASKYEVDLLKIDKEVVAQVITKAIHMHRQDPAYDSRPLIQLLMKFRGVRSVFQLLESERQSILENEYKQREQSQVQPLLTWSVNNLTNCFYKQSGTFQIQNAQWRLAVSYFKAEDTALKIEIKLINNPFDIKQNKNYYRKKDFDVPSNFDEQKIDPLAQFEVENEESDKQSNKVDQFNSFAVDYPNHTFVTFVSSVKVDTDKQMSEPQLNTLICSGKAPTELRRLPSFEIGKFKNQEINIGIFVKLNHMHSEILNYISRNFSSLFDDPDIGLLSKDEFKLLLKHKYLNVTNEDQVLRAVILWCQAKLVEQEENTLQLDESQGIQVKTVLKKSKQQQQDVNEIAGLSEILQFVNWDFVSLNHLLDCVKSYPYIRQNAVFQKVLQTQFALRHNTDDKEASKAAQTVTQILQPRYCYKFNRSQRQIYVTSDPNKQQSQNLASSRKFQTLNPMQTYPSFSIHLADCLLNPITEQGLGTSELSVRHLELKLATVKREAKFLEDQIKAIKMLDSIKNGTYNSARLQLNQSAPVQLNRLELLSPINEAPSACEQSNFAAVERHPQIINSDKLQIVQPQLNQSIDNSSHQNRQQIEMTFQQQIKQTLPQKSYAEIGVGEQLKYKDFQGQADFEIEKPIQAIPVPPVQPIKNFATTQTQSQPQLSQLTQTNQQVLIASYQQTSMLNTDIDQLYMENQSLSLKVHEYQQIIKKHQDKKLIDVAVETDIILSQPCSMQTENLDPGEPILTFGNESVQQLQAVPQQEQVYDDVLCHEPVIIQEKFAQQNLSTNVIWTQRQKNLDLKKELTKDAFDDQFLMRVGSPISDSTELSSAQKNKYTTDQDLKVILPKYNSKRQAIKDRFLIFGTGQVDQPSELAKFLSANNNLSLVQFEREICDDSAKQSSIEAVSPRSRSSKKSSAINILKSMQLNESNHHQVNKDALLSKFLTGHEQKARLISPAQIKNQQSQKLQKGKPQEVSRKSSQTKQSIGNKSSRVNQTTQLLSQRSSSRGLQLQSGQPSQRSNHRSKIKAFKEHANFNILEQVAFTGQSETALTEMRYYIDSIQ